MRSITHTTVVFLLGLSTIFGCKHSSTTLVIPDLQPRAGDSTSKEFSKAQETVSKLRAQIQQHPETVKNYTDLAQVFIQESRITGKHHDYYPVAESLLVAALSHDSIYFDALVLRSGIEMTKHRFAEAKVTVTKAISYNDHNAGSFGILADANTELGLYDEAVKAVDKMMSARPDLRSYARASYQREIRGDRDGAISAMKLAADAGSFGEENREWALYQFANLFLQWGKLDTAKFIYNGILEERPNFGYALSGLAMVAADKNDYGTAIGNLVKAAQILPEHIFIEQLSDLYVAMGDTANAHIIEQKVLQAFDLHEKDGWNIAREYAMYCANHNIHLKDALAQAEVDFKSRPENIDALDTYAWLLFKNNRAVEAKPLIEKVLRFHSLNASLYFHAAMIANANNDKLATQTYLTQALSTYLPPIYKNEAKIISAQVVGK